MVISVGMPPSKCATPPDRTKPFSHGTVIAITQANAAIARCYDQCRSCGDVRVSTRLSSVQIESFMTLARELNFSRAAEALHITQPALTKRIQSLEETLGQALFVRLHGGLELTESGRILQRYGAEIEHREAEVLVSLVGGG